VTNGVPIEVVEISDDGRRARHRSALAPSARRLSRRRDPRAARPARRLARWVAKRAAGGARGGARQDPAARHFTEHRGDTPCNKRTLLSLLAARRCRPLAIAQATWPSQPIRLIVPYPAGGGTDFFARLVAPGMGEALGQPVIVENRPGASGIIGATAVAKQMPADGHTFLLGDMTTYAVNPSMFEKLSYDPLKDLAPVTMTAKFDFLLVVNPNVLPVQNVQELMALAARTPAGISYASPSVGTTHHLATELLARETGMKLVAITYKGGGPACRTCWAARSALMFLDRATARPHLESGKLRPIAAAGSKRIAAYPNVPTSPSRA
jgi:tripartite-type tricarboxylate transporter receptor subunit TctC